MNNEKTHPLERKVAQALAGIPEPDKDFSQRLWRQIAARDVSEPRRVRGTWVRQPLRVALAFAAVMMLLSAVFFSTPQGKVLAQNILKFFRPAQSDQLIVATAAPVVWGAPQDYHAPVISSDLRLPFECGLETGIVCSLADVRSRVTFPVMALGTVPAPYHLAGINARQDALTLIYQSETKDRSLTLTQSVLAGAPPREVGAEAAVETVRIGNLEGEYLRGVFARQADDAVATWQPDAAAQTLRWAEDGVLYELQNNGVLMAKEAFLALAEGLTPLSEERMDADAQFAASENAVETMLRTRYPDSLAAVEAQAGFPVAIPAELPDSLQFLGAVYERESAVVSLFYPLILGGAVHSTNGLLLRQESLAGGEPAALGKFIRAAESLTPDSPAEELVGAVETVDLQGIAAQYVEGTWSGTDQGWRWDDTDGFVKRLRWQAAERAFELSYFGTELTRDDLIRIANGIAVSSADTGARQVLVQAEKVAGFSFILPKSLPAAWVLTDADFDAYLGVGSVVYTNQVTAAEVTLSQEIHVALPVELAPFGAVGMEQVYNEQPRSAMAGAVEFVTLDGAAAQYVEGAWQKTAFGWRWDPASPVKRLRWKTADRAFDLSSFGGTATRDDLIHFANRF